MKSIYVSFVMLVKQIKNDGILILILIAPILAAFFFRFGIPFAQSLILEHFDLLLEIQPYNRMIDLFLGMLTSYMFAFVVAMSMLEDYDNNIVSYLAITPLRTGGYLVSRFLIPSLISWFVSIVLVAFFSLDSWSMFQIVSITLLLTLSSFSIMLLIFSFSSNKVEGMAIAKTSGMTMVGLIVPFVFNDNIQYIVGFLPSFWIAKYAMYESLLYFIISLIMTSIWIYLLYLKFLNKLSKR